MKTVLWFLMFLVVSFNTQAQSLKKILKFSTFYGAFHGGTSLSDQEVYYVGSGKSSTEIIETPFDYSAVIGLRKIARFGYENRANTFYNGTENSFSDAATIGKISGFEFLFNVEYKRQEGNQYIDTTIF